MKRKKIIITYNKDSNSLKDILVELSSTHNNSIIYFIKQDMFNKKDNNIKYKVEQLQQEFSTVKLKRAESIKDILFTISDNYSKFKFFVIHESYLQDKTDYYNTRYNITSFLEGYAEAMNIEIEIIKEKELEN